MIPHFRIAQSLALITVALGTVVVMNVGATSERGPAARTSLYGSEEKRMHQVANRITDFTESFPIGGLVFSADGTQLATNAMLDGIDVHIWDWRGKSHIVRTLHKDASAGEGNAIVFSNDGRLLAVGHSLGSKENGFGLIRIWDSHSGEIVHDIAEPTGAVGSTPPLKTIL